MPASPLAHGSPASSASGTASGWRAATGWSAGQHDPDRVAGQLVADDAVGQAERVQLPLVGQHEVEVAERERGQRALGLGLDELAAQLRRLAPERLHRRQRDLQRHGLERRDPPAAGHRPGGRGELGLGERGALEQRLGVPDQHERRVGQPQPAAGLLEQRHAGLPLEHRELLRDRRRGELQRVGDRRHRPSLVQLAEQAEAAEIQHDEAMLHTDRNECVSLLGLRAVTMRS